jgi:hypothetical protein
LREVICPILKLREKNRTLVKVGGEKVDFFIPRTPPQFLKGKRRDVHKILLLVLAPDYRLAAATVFFFFFGECSPRSR